ncbi:MAG TPA: asparaginase [Gemmatimonadota bacterium]|nr:asparaginase [Gemmatimonadota bacterium]
MTGAAIRDPRADGRTPGVRVWRGGRIESLHAIHAAVAGPEGSLRSAHGDPGREAWIRSSAKPIQVLPLIEEGLVDRFGFTGPELAVMVASHGAQPFHLEAVKSVLRRAGLEPGLLQCGPHPPLDDEAAAELRRSGQEPDRIHNNCSGKHAGMLAACRGMGWPLETYLAPDHPLQERIHRTVAELAGLSPSEVPRAVDGCGAPTFYLPVSAMATAFARLAAADRNRETDRARAIGLVLDAMAAHPEHVAGTGRVDTDLMALVGGRVVVKTGAEGVFCAALRDSGLGLALKVADGAKRAQDVALIELLVETGALDEATAAALAGHRRPEIRNHAGRVVGRVDARLALEAPR